MDTKVLEKFCPWARDELVDAVRNRCIACGLDGVGRASAPRGSRIVNNVVLTDDELTQRDNLIALIDELGYEAFLEREAYTWFNRFAGIRYMELHGYLPSRVRMFSAVDGSFDPECLRAVGELDLPELDRDRALDLAAEGKDAELFRIILIAQCNQLADALPAVFDHVDDTDALMLPDGLLIPGEHNVLHHLVADIPERAWDDVEALGWMYQFYNADLKADFFKSKRKAAPEDIAPATQLFTPDWIVRYMVDNSLGRLWMLNFPDSRLRERASAENPADRLMEYYIEPDQEHEDFIRISGPEDITFCDPACGSGHILVYAFKMLMAMYEERGYREREIPELILTKNLSGMEIDERAAQIAQLALALCAREHDRRFFGRGIVADVRTLSNIELSADELPETSALVSHKHTGLLESLTHLGEIGSLLAIDEGELGCLRDDAKVCAHVATETGDVLLANNAKRLACAQSVCETLSRHFDVVVANPPYMGSSSFNPFMSKWMKKRYPDSCKDLCTAFIERGYSLAHDNGYAAMVTMQSWMFLGSFEKMRKRIIDEKTILTMAHLGPRAFDAIGGEVVSVTADVLFNGKTPVKGAYARLVDINGSEPKREKLLEAIHNPTCGWFYRADATTFHDIPGSPIAYWASEAAMQVFKSLEPLKKIAPTRKGMFTGNNDYFLKRWFEISHCKIGTSFKPYCKGGAFRRWYGNRDYVIRWHSNGKEIRESRRAGNVNVADYFKPCIFWSLVTSGDISFRIIDTNDFVMGDAGPACYPRGEDSLVLLGLLNSSSIRSLSKMINPTLNWSSGVVGSFPVPHLGHAKFYNELVSRCIQIARSDWDSQETSWDFKRNPLV
ncbi:BREX-1 system adenine-specific DNA-methyltransferase PglX [Collinsella tanakaei]|uniref:BREX-1 system adenine-specific DNA-methyltransferase PglX n=1 Tax=Collinsella tanakaei TaxID=626935 RepID=UPI0025A49FD5|nr:BREX-1 system adenine-specific DNA-methyltransferase PglX [Collinsella tanakaei]MDM8299301.1 BREX-1 system adenine-specific DNA-methyltransferase PglX [Collinsella tanakaei]